MKFYLEAQYQRTKVKGTNTCSAFCLARKLNLQSSSWQVEPNTTQRPRLLNKFQLDDCPQALFSSIKTLIRLINSASDFRYL